MIINKQELIDALTKVKPGLANNEIIEQSTNFCFDKRSVRTYNDQISIIYPIKTNIKGILPAEETFKLLERFPDEDIEIETKENQVILKGKRTTASINMVSEIRLPKIDLPKIEEKWHKLPEDFCEAIFFCSFSASKNMTIPELTCLNITKNQILCCDSFRAVKRTMKSRIRKPMMLPAQAAVQLAKYDPIEYIVTDAWIHFKNEGGTVFSCRTIANEYPTEKVEFYFSMHAIMDKITLPKDFQKVVDRVQIMATAEFDQDRQITLEFSKKGLTCRGQGPHGWVEETIRIRYKEDFDLKIETHPTFLSEILTHLNEIIIGDSVLLFEGENFKYIISRT